MTRTPVQSSQIASIGHDPEKQILHVEFCPRKGETQGQVYEYQNVPSNLHAELMKAESKGVFLNKRIVANRKAHPFKRVEKE